MRRHQPALLAVSVVATLGASSLARCETLADAIAHAYGTNPSLLSERFRLRADDEDYVQALAGLRPRADLQITGAYNRDQLGKTDRDLARRSQALIPDYSERNSGDAQLVLEQPLYTGGRVTAQISEAQAQVRAGREQLRAAEADVILQVIDAYASVRRDSKAVSIREANLEALTLQLTATRARKKAGEVTLTDVSQAEAQIAAERALLSTAKVQLGQSQAAYVAVVGSAPGELEAQPPLPGVPSSLEHAFDIAEADNPDLRQARCLEAQGRERIAAARAANRPQISLRGTYDYAGPIVPFDRREFTRGLTAQAVISQPLFAGGSNRSIVRQEIDRTASARMQVEVTRRAVIQNVVNAWNQATSARGNVAIQEEQVRAATVAFRGMQLEYRTGQRSTLDVLIAEETLRDAELALVSAERDAYVATAALLRATGRLEARALLPSGALYDPSANFRDVERRGSTPWDALPRAMDRMGSPSTDGRSAPAVVDLERAVMATAGRHELDAAPAESSEAKSVR